MAERCEGARGLQEIRELIGGRFARTEPRDTVIGGLRGLPWEEELQISWSISERAGHGTGGREATTRLDHGWGPG